MGTAVNQTIKVKPNTAACPNPTMRVSKNLFKNHHSWIWTSRCIRLKAGSRREKWSNRYRPFLRKTLQKKRKKMAKVASFREHFHNMKLLV